MSSRRRRSLFGTLVGVPWRLVAVLLLIAIVALGLSGEIESLQGGVLIMLPTVVLVIVMLSRPYPGEEVIAQLRARIACPAARLRPAPPLPWAPRTRLARGGRLIAMALAGRAPPPVLAGAP
ncbi:MAG TPA: hypothetical protein VND98_03980 [Solirubrobacterales bacterium]|nr:hypothetical protein [Solirubrobacterales bacterium]